jgi:hypothetical protein
LVTTRGLSSIIVRFEEQDTVGPFTISWDDVSLEKSASTRAIDIIYLIIIVRLDRKNKAKPKNNLSFLLLNNKKC